MLNNIDFLYELTLCQGKGQITIELKEKIDLIINKQLKQYSLSRKIYNSINLEIYNNILIEYKKYNEKLDGDCMTHFYHLIKKIIDNELIKIDKEEKNVYDYKNLSKDGVKKILNIK